MRLCFIRISRHSFFDDYVTQGLEKASGYSGMQDIACFPVTGRDVPVITEWQTQCRRRYENNKYGPGAGHVYYKTDMHDYDEDIMDWMRRAKASEETNEKIKPAKHIFVIGPRNRVTKLKVKNSARGVTVGHFLKASGIICDAVHMHDNYKLLPDNSKAYSRGSRIDNGYVIHAINPRLLPKKKRGVMPRARCS